jgi:hypothetical protein
MFQRNMSPPSSESKHKPTKKQHESRWQAELPEDKLFITTAVRTSNPTQIYLDGDFA